MANNNSINDNDLDDLLRRSFLESEKEMQKEADFVFNQEYDVNIDSKREKELLKKLSASKVRTNSPLNYYILISIVLALLIAIWVYTKSITKPSTITEKTDSTEQNNNNQTIDALDPQSNRTISLGNKIIKSTVTHLPFNDVNALTQIIDSVKSIRSLKDSSKHNQYSISNELLLEEFKNLKQIMLGDVLKENAGLYANVEAGKLNYCGSPNEIDEFVLRKCLVTNIEYKVFLMDLLMQSRKEDYEIAQVNSKTWQNYSCIELSNAYFQDEMYSDFPVVNISIAGVKLFCEWLQQEAILYAQNHNIKTSSFKIQVPQDLHLMYTAYNGYSLVSNCSGYNTVFDRKESYVNDAYLKRISKFLKNNKDVSLLDELYSVNRYGLTEQEAKALFKKGIDYYKTTTKENDYISRVKAYGKIAHVSEVVIEKKSNKPLVIGACWSSKEEYLKMITEFKNNSASPFVGFRIMIVHENAQTYKNPFW